MQNIADVFGECNTILFAFYFHHSEKVERWNGGNDYRTPQNKAH
jgi:hypothetical protein